MPAIYQHTLKTCLLVATLFVCFSSCEYKDPNALGHGKKPILSFKSVEGIYYTEVDRRLKNGLSFNEFGYHLAPEWKLRIVSEDTASLYSPVKKTYLTFPLSRGTDSVFNTARSYLRLKKMSKDSLVFDLLELQGDSMNLNGGRVRMLLYSDKFLKTKLQRDPKFLTRVNRKDSLFIANLAKKAKADITKAFAAQQPVQFISLKPQATVVKEKNIASAANNFNTSDDYMNPVYNITIYKAYEDFKYRFSVYVDDAGVMTYRKPLVGFYDDAEAEKSYNRVSTAVMNTYLKLYFKTIPGQTMGIKHASVIEVDVIGIKAAK